MTAPRPAPDTVLCETCQRWIDPADVDRCPSCAALKAERRGHSWLVAVYDVELSYGGPEEGGWWFDAGSLVRVVRVFRTQSAAEDYEARLNHRLRSRKFGPNKGRRPISSVLSDGEARAYVYEQTAPAGFPDRRPHYE